MDVAMEELYLKTSCLFPIQLAHVSVVLGLEILDVL